MAESSDQSPKITTTEPPAAAPPPYLSVRAIGLRAKKNSNSPAGVLGKAWELGAKKTQFGKFPYRIQK